MNVIATMGELYTERTLESKKIDLEVSPFFALSTLKFFLVLKFTLNFDRLFEVAHMVADPNPTKSLLKKRLHAKK